MIQYVFTKANVTKYLASSDYCEILDWFVAKADAGIEWHYVGCVIPQLGEHPVILQNDPIQVFIDLWERAEVLYDVGDEWPFFVKGRKFADLQDVLDHLHELEQE